MINLLSIGMFFRGRVNNLDAAILLASDGSGLASALPVRQLTYQDEKAGEFTRAVMKRSGQNLFSCYQCRRCAAGCPVNDVTFGITPNVLIRMVVLGDKQSALANELMWKCLSCNTCGTRCPNSINTGRVVESLKKMAKEAGVQSLRPGVVHFHASCYNDSLRWGRVSELGLMGEYQIRLLLDNLRQRKLRAIFDEISVQVKFAYEMFKLKRLHLFFHTSRGRIEIKRLLKKSAGRKWI